MQLFIEVTDQDTRFLDPSWAKLKGWIAGCQKELGIGVGGAEVGGCLKPSVLLTKHLHSARHSWRSFS